MKWKKVSEHPLPPDTYKTRRFLIKLPDGKINFTDCPSIYNAFDGAEWCEFNPDEIESADVLDVPSILKGKSEYKSATEVMGEFKARQELAMNQAMVAKRLMDEPSWEEKFRWETAAKLFCSFPIACAINKGRHQPEIDANYSVQCVDILIEQLKRGRE